LRLLITDALGQARKAAALAENFSPVDEVADEKLKQEAKEEERNIKRTCEELGVRIHEVEIFYRSVLEF
jgi:OTU domain-containing protein 6